MAFTLIFFFFAIILLNGFAAGVAAAIYLWRRNWSRRRRILVAVGLAGLVPTLMFSGIAIFAPGSVEETGMVVVFLLFVFGGGGALVSLPGAIAMSRRIERGPSLGDTFD